MYNLSDLYVVAVKNDTGTDTLICKKCKKNYAPQKFGAVRYLFTLYLDNSSTHMHST